MLLNSMLFDSYWISLIFKKNDMKDYLEYKGYLGTVNYSANDKVFYGKLEGINDLVNFEADNVSDLEAGFKEAVKDYLETCKELGKTPEKTYKGIFNVRVPSSIHKNIAMLAAKKGIKLNDLVNQSLDYLINNQEKVLKG